MGASRQSVSSPELIAKKDGMKNTGMDIDEERATEKEAEGKK